MSHSSQPLRVAILCSFNLELIARNLETSLKQSHFEPYLYFSAYGQWESDALNSASEFYQFRPDIVLLFTEFCDLIPYLETQRTDLTLEEAQQLGKSAWLRVEGLINPLLQYLPPHTFVLCHNLLAPPIATLGLLEGNAGYSLTFAAEVFNQQLRDRVKVESRLFLLNYVGLVTQHGWSGWYDARLWHLARIRLSKLALKQLTEYYLRYIAALKTPRRKCLVLDLDNTMWGGVIGEDGLLGLQLGHEGIGLAYREFQMAVHALSRRGIILAVCSKNNPDDALTVLRNHPDNILHPEHFACLQINWEPKPQNLQRIAQTLNIGLGSLVFWDDSPIERDIVRHQLPEVLVVDVPEDPSEYATHLLNLHCFDTLTLTAEDQRRGEMYQQQAQRTLYLEQPQSESLQDFYRSLEIRITICEANPFSLPRIAQLTQRTNQFNFTTRRYSEPEILSLAGDRDYRLYTLQQQDRFGDLGIVGTAIVRCESSQWYLENFLMSCRALGRNVEDAFLCYLTRQATHHSVKLRGCFKPTLKNAPTVEFLAKYSIAPPADWQGEQWEFEIPGTLVQNPVWIELVSESENVTA